MSIDRMILLVTGISAGIELIFGYRWQLTERVECGPEILEALLLWACLEVALGGQTMMGEVCVCMAGGMQ